MMVAYSKQLHADGGGEKLVTADEVVGMVIANFRGPVGTMLTALGALKSPGQSSSLCVGRQVVSEQSAMSEAFQIEFMSPTSGGIDGVEKAGKKYRGVREHNSENDLVKAGVYLPGLRRGRGLSWVPYDGVLGTEFKFYYLTPVSNFRYDFLYRFIDANVEAPVIEGVRLPTSRSPFVRSRIYLKRISIIYVPVKIEYWVGDNKLQPVTVEFRGYAQVVGASGYWAPNEIASGQTSLTFLGWHMVGSQDWMMSTNHQVIEIQQVPCVIVAPAN